jgi:protein TonB
MYSIQEKITYPEIAKRAGIQGKVIIQAFIDENGNVVHAKVLTGIGGGCDEMALDAVKQTKFNPGRQNGKPVKVQVTIPIVFKLQ